MAARTSISTWSFCNSGSSRIYATPGCLEWPRLRKIQARDLAFWVHPWTPSGNGAKARALAGRGVAAHHWSGMISSSASGANISIKAGGRPRSRRSGSAPVDESYPRIENSFMAVRPSSQKGVVCILEAGAQRLPPAEQG